ncbi:MAG: hypothetical protein KC425_02900 [Anaerolineales bacterium]|nr:hypothetical protein [Anaerolineales bacterium]
MNLSSLLKKPLVWLAVLLLAGLLGWWLAPHAIRALPSQIRFRLPEPVLALVTTPVPTALPAPAGPVDLAQVGRLLPSATPLPPTPTLAPTPTLPATFTPAPTEAAATPVPPTPTATPSPAPTAVPTTPPLPAQVEIAGMSIVPQKFNNCGAANLSLVLDFYDHPVDQLDIAAVVRPTYDDRNASPSELVDFVNFNTPLRAASYVGGDLPLLQRLLAAGYPVIVEKGLLLEEIEGWMGHYLTLFGYDDAAQTFASLDTFLGPFDSVGRPETYERLLRYWHHFNYRFVVVYPPEAETAVAALLGPTYTDPLAMWRHAADRARETAATSPNDAYAWFNYGSSLTHLAELTGDAALYADAATLFDQARTIGLPWRMLWYQFEPYAAYLGAGRPDEVLILADALLSTEGGRGVEETFLYRGHALLARGDAAGARRAYRAALDIRPHFPEAEHALQALDAPATVVP